MRVCVCLSVCPPAGLLKIIHIKFKEVKITNQTSPTAFQFLCMALAIDIVDGWGLSNVARRVLLQKKSKVMLYLPSIT